MKRGGPKSIVASVQTRLVERSRELGVEYQLTLARFGAERLLHRLWRSELADRFILKGAALLLLWLREPIRGMRVKLMARLGNVRIPLQVDVGAGDAVVPPPEGPDYPGLLDLPRAHLRAYWPETSIAGKTEAMVRLAMANSRMKDFFDIHRLAETRSFDGETMRLAVAGTFARRGIEVPAERPVALTRELADHAQKKTQWAAFVRRARRRRRRHRSGPPTSN